jgi:hypothetical protein
LLKLGFQKQEGLNSSSTRVVQVPVVVAI